MIRIERIETAGPDRRARRLVFSDDIEPRTTSASVVKALGLSEGETYPDELLADSLTSAERTCADERAMRLVGYRERSVAELKKRLIDDGYPHAIASEVTVRYEELRFVDDQRFAETLIRTRAAAGHGRRRIEQELARKSVPPEVAAAAFEETLGDTELERAIGCLRDRMAPIDSKQRDKLVRRLITRGYSFDVIRQAIASLPAQPGDDAPFVAE